MEDFEKFNGYSQEELGIMLAIDDGLNILSTINFAKMVYLGNGVAELRHPSGAVAVVKFGYDLNNPHMVKLTAYADRKAMEQGSAPTFEESISYRWVDRLAAIWVDTIEG